MELEQLRKEIDNIDRQLVSLFVQRMNCSANVAEYKRENNMPVLDRARERALLGKISELAGEEFEDYARTMYATILSLSRSYQHTRLGETTELCGIVDEALEKTSKLFKFFFLELKLVVKVL